MILKLDNGIAKVLGRPDAGTRYTNRQVYSLLSRLRADERPFFMFVSNLEAHSPYRAPRKYNRYLPDGVSPRQSRRVNQDRYKYMTGHTAMDEQDFEILTALYDGAITYLDTRIAEVLGWLEQLDLLDQTMVIITADHGENFGEHQLISHGYCLYDTVIHVPLIIHYPKGITTPGRVTHQVQTLDLLPTILAMLGDVSSETYRSLQGYDLLSSTRRDFTVAEQAHPDLTLFYEKFPAVDVSRYDRALKAIRTDRYKYVWASDGHHELYDLQADPDEECDIIAEHPDTAEALDQRLMEWRNSFEEASPSDQIPGSMKR
jgi:arylsulfatase A-like enzyme